MDKEEKERRRGIFHKAINYFLFFIISIIVLLLIAIGLTQTSTFREFARKQVLNILNDSLNGKFNIERIDGTIFTTLTVRNASLVSLNNDTIASINRVSTRFKPLYLFRGVIFVKNLELDGVSANLIKDSTGIYNIEKVFPSKAKDTTETDFPFKIRAEDIHISNLACNVLQWNNVNDFTFQNNLNLNNFRVHNLDLDLGADINIHEKFFKIILNNLSFDSNIKNFNLNGLAGKFTVDKNHIAIDDFDFKSKLTSLKLNVKLQNFNVFAPFDKDKFGKTSVSVFLSANDFNFDDLSAFVPPTSMLKGNLTALLEANGTVNNLDINTLKLQYGKTILETTGNLENLSNPSHLLIHAKFKNSRLVENDIADLLPTIDLPRVKGFEELVIDSLTYDGTPLKFISKFKVLASGGVIRSTADLDFSGDVFTYDVSMDAGNVDLQPLANHPVTFNGGAKIKGKGVNPKTAVINYAVNGNYSVIGKQVFQYLHLDGVLDNAFLKTSLNAKTNIDSISFSTNIDFSKDSLPRYTAYLQTDHLDLFPIMIDSTMHSDINFTMKADAKGFHPDKISGNFDLKLNNSLILGKSIDDFAADCSIESGANLQKNISLKSEMIDCTASGNFSFLNIGDIIAYQISGITASVKQKINSYFKRDSFLSRQIEKLADQKIITDSLMQTKYNLNFKVLVKNINKVNLLLTDREINGEGTLEGKISNDRNGFLCQLKTDLPFAKYYDKNDAYFLRDAQIDFTFSKPVYDNSIPGLTAKLHTTIDRIFVNSDIKKIDCNLDLQNGKLAFTGSAGLNDNMSSTLSANIDFGKDSLFCAVDRIKLKYNNFELINKDKFTLKYFSENLIINHFNMWRGEAKILADGIFSMKNEMNLKLTVDKFKGYDISYNILGIAPANVIDNDITFQLVAKGTLLNPKYDFIGNVDSITFKKVNFGSLVGNLHYENKKLITDIKFVEKTGNVSKSRLVIAGYAPVDLSFPSENERMPKNGVIDLHVISNDFNLSSFGDALPYVSHIKGLMNARLDFTGTIGNMIRNGYMKVSNAAFKLDPNNLYYGGGFLVHLKDQTVYLDSFVVKNLGKVKNKGTLKGTGMIEYVSGGGMNMRVDLNGELTVLSEESRTSTSFVYGDCFIATDGDITFAVTKDRSFLSVPLIVKEAKLVYPLSQSAYSGSGDNFVYHFIEEVQLSSGREMEIQKVIAASGQRKLAGAEVKSTGFNFDYEVKVKIKDEVNFIFDFAQGANQKLNAVLKGDLLFERKNGIQNFQGELKVLEGSTFEFLKTFTATGTLRFESDVTNPYLDIVGVYKAYYASSDTTQTNAKDEEVAVKIKLKGPIKDLAKNFSQDENNISVYVGASNIDKDNASTEYDKADAMWFIITGKFKKDLTQAEKSKAAGQIDLLSGTATSLAGSLIGGMLNTYLGDYVKSIEIRNVGTATKFNLTGKLKSFRYTIGGSTNFLQDLSSANIRIEYPIFESLLLRLERKESVTETNTYYEMINELGLRYKFEF